MTPYGMGRMGNLYDKTNIVGDSTSPINNKGEDKGSVAVC